jgi:SAM-dependent methyltransferase
MEQWGATAFDGSAMKGSLIEYWRQEAAAPFVGWDFSYLHGRMVEELPPWSYPARAAELMRRATHLLDMGTGGGERLLALREHWPATLSVTEDYPPNVALARERLGSLGVRVEEASLGEHDLLPFGDGSFDLVLNRHSGIPCAEVARVLARGGVFLTQHVHGLWAESLIAAFGARPQWPHATGDYFGARLQQQGLVLDRAETWEGELVFTDVGAVAYYLKAVPWLVPGFSVDTHLAPLLALQDRLEREGRLVFEARSYLLEAHKPALLRG